MRRKRSRTDVWTAIAASTTNPAMVNRKLCLKMRPGEGQRMIDERWIVVRQPVDAGVLVEEAILPTGEGARAGDGRLAGFLLGRLAVQELQHLAVAERP